MPTCRHGTYNHRLREMTGAEARVAERHRERTGCTATTFGHPGTWVGIFTVICCTKHGQVS